MKNLRGTLQASRIKVGLLMMVALIVMFGVVSTSSRASAPSLSITVVNNSSWEIRHLYLSPANNDNWGDDQLNQSTINPGGRRTLNVSWDQSTVKLVAEDQDGCFLSTTVAASADLTWTIAGTESRNCGN
jgi:hypothetical protein